LIFSSIQSSIYYGFYCLPHLQTFYITLLTLLATTTSYVLLSPHFTTPRYRIFRISCFIALAASALFPLIHAYLLYGGEYISLIGGQWMLRMAALYIVGVVFFVGRIPERWAIGSFDIIGNSHQIWHLFVIAAMCAHFCGLREGFTFTSGIGEGGCELGMEALVSRYITVPR
jgi:adiponectin receptor